MFKRNGFLTTENSLNYEAISNYYMKRNPKWAEALKSAAASVEKELSSQFVLIFNRQTLKANYAV
jgi:hypothetical protein